MKILLFGANGQLGKTLKLSKPKDINLISLTKSEFNFLDVEKHLKILDEIKPNYIINAAAYTNVDKAEDENEIAEEINSKTPFKIASKLLKMNGRFIHISTDFVFDGKKSSPYTTEDKVSPLNEYGKSKSNGELLISKLNNTTIVRTSWLYSPFGKNFCLTMLRLHKECSEKNLPLKVVCDQFSCPTSTFTLSKLCWQLIQKEKFIKQNEKILHCTDSGIASWYDFAFAIGEIGEKLQLIEKSAEVIPIKTVDFKSKALRPSFSLLDCSKTNEILGLGYLHWRISLEKVLQELKVTHK